MTASSFVEIIYIDSEDNARQTNLRTACNTNAATHAAFRSFRRHAVDIKQARFLLDYHNARGDLSDTIAIDDTGFRAVTGQEPKTDAEYVKLDSDYWDEVRKDRKPSPPADQVRG